MASPKEEFALPLSQGMVETSYGRFEIKIFPCSGEKILEKKYTKWFDCDKIKDTPVVRTRQTGDYIMLDEDRKKALRRFMIDEKIPADKRDQVALLADGDHIMWIIGRRISSYYKIGPDTRRVLQAKVSQSTLS